MEKDEALEKLKSIGQQHLLKGFDDLLKDKQESLLKQIETFNIPTFRLQQQMLIKSEPLPLGQPEPFNDFSLKGNAEDRDAGLKLIEQGKVGCLLIAGGLGTRLKSEGPKGTFPVSLIKKKSLFQIFCEKVLAAGKQAGQELFLAVMTSEQNHEETLSFFAKHLFFGLDPQHIDFFKQGTLPLLDHEGNLFLDRPGHIAEGPDGNGSSLAYFANSSIWTKWYEKGIRYVCFALIDNPLADPFDAELVGKHSQQGADVMIKCTTRDHASENVGIIVKHENGVKVVEYTEMPIEEKEAIDSHGKLKHRLANISLFSFSMDFIKKVSKLEMPLHLAHKAVKFLNSKGTTVQSEEPNAWKFEKFIFDLIPHALRVHALLYPRKECFAPLKSLNGETSLEKVQEALLKRDKKILAEITGYPPPEGPIELSQDFYYPTDELLQKFKGQKLKEGGYIDPDLSF